MQGYWTIINNLVSGGFIFLWISVPEELNGLLLLLLEVVVVVVVVVGGGGPQISNNSRAITVLDIRARRSENISLLFSLHPTLTK